MMPYCRIDGTDVISYIDEDGYAWSENDLDSDDSGRTLDGVMHRGRIALKEKLEISFRPLTPIEAQTVLEAISNKEFVTVETNMDPKYGEINRIFYNSSRTASVATIYNDGTVCWSGIKASLIEQ